jgi:hypothetical protein
MVRRRAPFEILLQCLLMLRARAVSNHEGGPRRTWFLFASARAAEEPK